MACSRALTGILAILLPGNLPLPPCIFCRYPAVTIVLTQRFSTRLPDPSGNGSPVYSGCMFVHSSPNRSGRMRATFCFAILHKVCIPVGSKPCPSAYRGARVVALPEPRRAAPTGAVGSARMQSMARLLMRRGFLSNGVPPVCSGRWSRTGGGGTNSPRKVRYTFCY